MKGNGIYRAFLRYFKPHLKLFILDMFCASVVAAIDLIYPFITRGILMDMLNRGAFRTFFTVIALLLALFIVRSLFQYIITYWGHTFGIRVEADMRKDLFTHIQGLSFDFYDKNRTPQLMSRLTTDLFDITELAHHGPEDVLISVLTIAGSLIFMFLMEWHLALVIAVITPIGIAAVLRNRKDMSSTSRRIKEEQAGINSAIESGLSGIRVSRAYTAEHREKERFAQANDRFRTSKKDFHKVMGRYMATVEFFISLLSLTVLGVGGYLIMKGSMGYADLLAFTLYVSAFTTPVRKLAQFSETFAAGSAGLYRFAEIMRLEPTVKDAPDAKTIKNAKGHVCFNDVSFHYEDDREVLHNIDLDIRPGEKIGVVGSSGGGKSTLCRLIPRFYDVDSGCITLDGTDIREIKQVSLRSQIGVVEQDVFLFADTIRENIRYGRLDASDDEIYEAAGRAEILEDILEMPNGFDTYVGERGTLLSGGQKQRIAVARVFLKNPPILILDEATSAMDSVTEKNIQRSLEKLAQGRTTIVIAHRLSTIRDSDRIIVIENGRIIEQGTHDQLMALDGEYARLSNAQDNLPNKQNIE